MQNGRDDCAGSLLAQPETVLPPALETPMGLTLAILRRGSFLDPAYHRATLAHLVPIAHTTGIGGKAEYTAVQEVGPRSR